MTTSTSNTAKLEPPPGTDLIGRHTKEVAGHLRCFDRVIVYGTLVDVAHPGALLVSMNHAGFRPRDLARFAEPIGREVRDHIIGLARRHEVEVEMVTRKSFRQEDRIAAILQERGTQPGLVHVFAVKETATVFDTRHARADGYAQVITRRGCCLHYYLYWIHERLGLIHVRVPTWLPLRLQVYFNGHNWLARQMDQAGIKFPNGYHWCLTQVEYAQDLVFKDPARLDRLFEEVARQALLVIKVEEVARFLGKRVPLNHDTPLNSHFGRRHAGLRLKHRLGPASVKLYNKPGGILRLEMTTYDVSFFRHYRQVVHQNGTKEDALATMKKPIYSLRDLTELMQAGVNRYSQWLASLVEHSAGRREVARLGRPEHDQRGRSYRGFNPFLEEDTQALETVLRGEYALGGLTARRLHSVFTDWSRGRVGRLLKRLRLHGLLRKIARTHTYYLTPLAQRVLAAILHLKEYVFVQHLAATTAVP